MRDKNFEPVMHLREPVDWQVPPTPESEQKPHELSLLSKTWFSFLLGWTTFTAIFLPIAEKAGYWTSAIPAGILFALYFTVVMYLHYRRR